MYINNKLPSVFIFIFVSYFLIFSYQNYEKSKTLQTIIHNENLLNNF